MNSISNREKEVLHLIAYEYTAKEIATKLFISAYTVNDHRKSLLAKLNVKNTAGMIRRGFECGLLTLNTVGISNTYDYINS